MKKYWHHHWEEYQNPVWCKFQNFKLTATRFNFKVKLKRLFSPLYFPLLQGCQTFLKSFGQIWDFIRTVFEVLLNSKIWLLHWFSAKFHFKFGQLLHKSLGQSLCSRTVFELFGRQFGHLATLKHIVRGGILITFSAIKVFDYFVLKFSLFH